MTEKVLRCTYCFETLEVGQPHDIDSCADHLRDMVIGAEEIISHFANIHPTRFEKSEKNRFLMGRLQDRAKQWLKKYGGE